MKLTIENTDQIVELLVNGTNVPARLWIGRTGRGVRVHVMITRIAVVESDDQSQFQRELLETPGTRVLESFPLRMVL